MKNNLLVSVLFSTFAFTTAFGHGGKYYGLTWDGYAEYFVSFDPATSTSTALDSLPGVKLVAAGNSAFDTHCDRYIFVGGAKTSAMSYYVIDAHTGAVLSQSPVSGRAVDNIAYSPKDRAFYGILWDASTSTESFVSLDPYTSTTTILAAIPGVKLIQAFNSAFDTDSNRYVFIGGPTNSAMSYYVIDAGTGAMVSQSAVGGKINNLKYSPRDKTFYGLSWDGSTEYLAAVDPYGSASGIANPIPGVKLIAAGIAAFNTDCNQYVFIGGATSSSMSNYVLDASTGAIVSQSAVADKINNLQYDGKCKRRCVHRHICRRGDHDDTTEVVVEDSTSVGEDILIVDIDSTAGGLAGGPTPSLAPLSNPEKPFIISGLSSGDIVLQIGKAGDYALSFRMLDLSGKEVIQVNDIRTNRVRVSGNGLIPALYFFQLRGGRGLLRAGKLLVK